MLPNNQASNENEDSKAKELQNQNIDNNNNNNNNNSTMLSNNETTYENLLKVGSFGHISHGFYDKYTIGFKDIDEANKYCKLLNDLYENGVFINRSTKVNKVETVAVKYNRQKNSHELQLSHLQWKLLGEKIKSNAQPQKQSSEYIIKSVRADTINFWRSFILGITPSQVKYPKPPLRKGLKDKYVGTATYQGLTVNKPPQYSPEEKQNYSKAQSVSLVTNNIKPKVFGFTKRELLVGTMIDRKDALFGNKMYVYDGGTVSRPGYKSTYEKAYAYYERKVLKEKVLFSDEEKFKEGILNRPDKPYNEVLARIRWNTDGTSKIFIASDNLESRLTAQDYARTLLARLKQQALENNQPWDDSYQIPICFYSPDNPQLHLRPYDVFSQKEDVIAAQEIIADKKKFLTALANEEYELLLAHDHPEDLLYMKINDTDELIMHLLSKGYVHIVQSIFEKIGKEKVLQHYSLPQSKLASFFSSKMQHALYHVARVGDLELVNWMLKQKPGMLSGEYNPILVAAEFNNDRIVKALINTNEGKKLINDQTNSKPYPGYTSLHLAIAHKNLDLVKFLLANGADYSKQNSNELTPYELALITDFPEAVDEIVKTYKTTKHKSSIELDLLAAAHTQNWEELKNIINNKKNKVADIDISDYILWYACKHNQAGIALSLLNSGVTPDYTDFGNTSCLHLIATNPADLYTQELTKALITNKDYDAKEFLTKRDRSDDTPIVAAAKANNWGVVMEIANLHPASDRDNEQYGFALIIALRQKKPGIANELLTANASISLHDGSDNSALHYALGHEYVEIVKQIVKHPNGLIAFDKPNNQGMTPLQIALQSDNNELLAALFSEGLTKSAFAHCEDVIKTASIKGDFKTVEKLTAAGFQISPNLMEEINQFAHNTNPSPSSLAKNTQTFFANNASQSQNDSNIQDVNVQQKIDNNNQKSGPSKH